MTHELKILPKYFNQVITGKKTFELRRNDRDFKVGDEIILREYSKFEYTGRFIKLSITYIFDDYAYGLENGYVILGIE